MLATPERQLPGAVRSLWRCGPGWGQLVLAWHGVVLVIALDTSRVGRYHLHHQYHRPLQKQRQRHLGSLASGNLLVVGWPDDDSQP